MEDLTIGEILFPNNQNLKIDIVKGNKSVAKIILNKPNDIIPYKEIELQMPFFKKGEKMKENNKSFLDLITAKDLIKINEQYNIQKNDPDFEEKLYSSKFGTIMLQAEQILKETSDEIENVKNQ